MDLSHISNNNKLLITIFVVLLVFSAGAFYYARPGGGGEIMVGGNGGSPAISVSQAAVTAIVEETLPSVRIYSLTGTLTKKSGNILTIDVPHILGVNIPKEAGFRTRTVLVSEETVMRDRVLRTGGEFERELELFFAGKLPGEDLPPPYVLVPVDIATLTVGNLLTIEGGVEDIKIQTTIQATRVTREL